MHMKRYYGTGSGSRQHEYWREVEQGIRRMDDDDLRLLSVIRSALAAGIHYTADMQQHVASVYGIPESEWHGANVEGGLLGMEVYYCRRELSRIEQMGADVTAAQRMTPGFVARNIRVGSHTFAKVTVDAIVDGVVSYTASKRGSRNRWAGKIGAAQLVEAA